MLITIPTHWTLDWGDSKTCGGVIFINDGELVPPGWLPPAAETKVKVLPAIII